MMVTNECDRQDGACPLVSVRLPSSIFASWFVSSSMPSIFVAAIVIVNYPWMQDYAELCLNCWRDTYVSGSITSTGKMWVDVAIIQGGLEDKSKWL